MDLLKTPLTAMSREIEEIAMKSIILLLNEMDGKESPEKKKMLIPTRVIERSSVRNI